MAAEEWKFINDFYMVSSLGNVKSLSRTIDTSSGKRKYKEKLLSLEGSINGYPVVNISGKAKKVHQLVAKAYIPNPKKLPVINHINGNKKDNTVSNLEWCTQQHNCSHAYKTGLRNPVINKEGRNGFSKKVKNKLNGKIYDSVTQVIRIENPEYSYTALRAMLSGQNPNKSNFEYI